MPFVGKNLTAMGPGDRRLRGFNFDRTFGRGEIVDSASFTLSVEAGSAADDATPAARLDGDARIDGTRAFVWVKEPLIGVTYRLTCVAISSNGAIATLWSTFTVRA